MLKDPRIRAASARSFACGVPRSVERFTFLDRRAESSGPRSGRRALYALSQAYRSDKKEAEMFLALNTLAQNYPVSKWTEEG